MLMPNTGKPTIEEQLALYRRHKKKEEKTMALRERLWAWLRWMMVLGSTSVASSSHHQQEYEQGHHSSEGPGGGEVDYQDDPSIKVKKRSVLSKSSSSDQSRPTDLSDGDNVSFLAHYTTLDWMALALKCCLWALLMKVFIIIEFGAVFFIFSAFVFIWYNLRSGPKKKGEISAYSVFNPNCKIIEGTFTAEQFERELLFKM